MRVRLTVKKSAKHRIVQDAVGEIVGIEFDPREFAVVGASDWRDNAAHPARVRGWVRLRYMPTAVHVRVEKYDQDVGAGPGIVLVRPERGDWDFNCHIGVGDARQYVPVAMRRVQIPLAPEKVRTVQSAQGMSMDAALCFLSKQKSSNKDDWWLHVYVMLSRVRTIGQLLIFGHCPRELFEQGPPADIVQGFQRLSQVAAACAANVEEACAWFGLPPIEQVASDSSAASQPVDVDMHRAGVTASTEVRADAAVVSASASASASVAQAPVPTSPNNRARAAPYSRNSKAKLSEGSAAASAVGVGAESKPILFPDIRLTEVGFLEL